MKSAARWLVFGIAAALLAWGAAHASGGSPIRQQQDQPPPPVMTPEQMAIEHYNAGLAFRDKAWKLEKELSAADSDAERQKIQAKIGKQLDRAREEFESAVKNNPAFHEAWSDLGYVLRKVGRYEDALDSYDQALQLDATYTPAIEYRAEAYLGLNQIEPAKSAYVDLVSKDRKRANQLFAAMQKWIEARRTDAGGVDTETIDAFAAWVAERAAGVGPEPGDSW